MESRGGPDIARQDSGQCGQGRVKETQHGHLEDSRRDFLMDQAGDWGLPMRPSEKHLELTSGAAMGRLL